MAHTKPGRNDPCNCGSGNKYKNCCIGKAEFRPPAPTPPEFDQLVALFNSRRYEELESRTRSLLERYPDSGFAWKLLGASLQVQGKDALSALQQATKLLPEDADAHSNLGVALANLGQLDDAVASYRRALELKPDFAEAHSNLGSVLTDLGQLNSAEACCRRALLLKPDYARAHNHLGNALQHLGQFDGAEASYRCALELKPDYAEAHNNLGNVLQDLGQLDSALASYRRALELKPDYANAHNNLGTALTAIRQFDNALASYRRALELKPDYAEAHNNLGNALRDRGRFTEAEASFRRALEIKPDFTKAHSNLLFALNYTAGHSPEVCLAKARRYGEVVAKKVDARFSAWQCEERPKRLRVGLVSGDLLDHPVGYFLEGMLAQIDPNRIELVAYPTDPRSSALTARIKPYFAAWKPVYGLSDAAAAKLIHADGVHVLLDISGHTAKNRLPVFAWKPAPVQASWLGYFATTGLAEMDYVLADPVNMPPGVGPSAQHEHFCETVWYLDTYQCLTPPDVDLPIASLPALKNGYITFGCFQRLDKAGDAVLSTWATILNALPKARLSLDCKQLGDPAEVNRMVQRLQHHGIARERVVMRGAAPTRDAYLARYDEVDMMLDTFPYPGSTTTCEALWMGVPTLTLSGDRLLARAGASVLTAAGLEEWISTSVAGYIDKAVAFAGDLPRLASLRAGLREQVRTSPLFDAPRFARNFEAALWGMWEARSQ